MKLNNLITVTDHIDINEACLGLYELDFQADDTLYHRYQVIIVNRGGSPAEYRKDLGLSSNYKGVDQIRIPGGVVNSSGRVDSVHTVGELIDIANDFRFKATIDLLDIIGVNKINKG